MMQLALERRFAILAVLAETGTETETGTEGASAIAGHLLCVCEAPVLRDVAKLTIKIERVRSKGDGEKQGEKLARSGGRSGNRRKKAKEHDQTAFPTRSEKLTNDNCEVFFRSRFRFEVIIACGFREIHCEDIVK